MTEDRAYAEWKDVLSIPCPQWGWKWISHLLLPTGSLSSSNPVGDAHRECLGIPVSQVNVTNDLSGFRAAEGSVLVLNPHLYLMRSRCHGCGIGGPSVREQSPVAFPPSAASGVPSADPGREGVLVSSLGSGWVGRSRFADHDSDRLNKWPVWATRSFGSGG